MNLGELLAQVSAKMSMSDDVNTADGIFLTRAANRGTREVLERTRCYVKKATLTLTEGTTEYDLTTALGLTEAPLVVLEASNSNDDSRSTFTLVQGDVLLERQRRQIASSTTRRFSLFGTNLLLVQPAPESDMTIDVYLVPAPANPLSDDADDPSDAAFGNVPEMAHRAIEQWMCMESAEKLRQFDAVEYYRKQFELEIVQVLKKIRGRANRRLAPPRIGYPDEQGPIGRNDVYPAL